MTDLTPHFSKMTYRIDVSGKMLDEFPELKSVQEYGEVTDSELRYIFILYDQALYGILPSNLSDRKACAFIHAKIPGPILEFKDDRKEMIAASTRFLIDQSSLEFELLVSINVLYHNLLEEARNPVTGLTDDKKLAAYTRAVQCSNDAHGILEKIRAMEQSIFGNLDENDEAVIGARQFVGNEAMAVRYGRTGSNHRNGDS